MTAQVPITTFAGMESGKSQDIVEKPPSSPNEPSLDPRHKGLKDDEVTEPLRLSTTRLLFAHIGAALTLFLATTDATIVSTALPTIASDLHASQMQYTWVGVSYMLTQTALQPLYGRISDLVGRKTVLHTSIGIFAVGSLLCGVAKSAKWLIAARALAGVGGGGIVSSVWVITSEIVEIQHRARWSQALSITWSCSAVAGPLLGGVFSNNQGKGFFSWRWGFYINLPICAFAVAVITLSLRNVTLTRDPNASFVRFVSRFDFGGLVLFIGGSGSIVVGFGLASDAGWTSASTLAGIILGIVLLIAAGFHENHTKRDCLFPPTMFRNSTAVIILLVSFLHNFAFNAGTFYLALYYQAANGSTPFQAGMKMLPYSLGSSLASMPAAWFIGFWQRRKQNTSGQNIVISSGLLLSTLGFGLFNLLHETSSLATQTVFPLVAGIGIGMLFHSPYQVFTKSVKPSELATGTSAFFLVRFTGATVGLAAAGAIFSARSSKRLPENLPMNGPSQSIDYSALINLQPQELKDQVLSIVASSIRTIWIVCTPLLGLSFLMSLFLKTMEVSVSEVSSTDSGGTVQSPPLALDIVAVSKMDELEKL